MTRSEMEREYVERECQGLSLWLQSARITDSIAEASVRVIHSGVTHGRSELPDNRSSRLPYIQLWDLGRVACRTYESLSHIMRCEETYAEVWYFSIKLTLRGYGQGCLVKPPVDP